MNTNIHISQEEFERIEAYLNNQLSKEDLAEFEHRLSNESHFAAKVEDVKITLAGIETQALKEQLNVFHNEISKTKVRTLNWKPLAIAAAFIIAAGSFWFLNGNSNDRLYAKYFTPDPGLPTAMSNTDNYAFYEAMVDYKQGNYDIALNKWKTIQTKKPNNDTLNYFMGVAHLANKNQDSAIPFLEKSSKNPEFILSQDAYYYLGLAYLKEGQIENAKMSLRKSDNENSRALLSKLQD